MFACDKEEGIYYITEAKSEYLRDLGAYSDGACPPFGHVQNIAYNAGKTMLALYTDPETTGTIVVILSDLSRELNRQQTAQVGASQVYWCGNSSIVLTINDKIAIVGPSETENIELRSRADGIYCTTEDDGLRVVTPDGTFFLELV